MFYIKLRNYKGKLIMLLHQTTEHVGDKEIELYKVIIEVAKNETVTIERARKNEIIFQLEEGQDV